jgi:hypothetical protein
MRGGLGNQLFQYAYAKKLQHKYNADNIILDIREYTKYKVRDFELGSFELNSSVIIADNIKNNYKYEYSKNVYFYLNGFLKKSCNQNLDFLFPLLSKFGLYYSARKIYDDKLIINFDNIFLYGYFQDVSGVDEMKLGLINDLIKCSKSHDRYNKLLLSIKNSVNSIAISVRCGIDYIKAGYNICTTEYYMQGINILTSNLTNYHIYVFSDEVSKAKEMFYGIKNVTFVEHFDATEQLMLMKECHYFIISNSSFAWWGAYLSQYSDKLVYVPQFWYPKKKTKNTNLIYPNVRILEL